MREASRSAGEGNGQPGDPGGKFRPGDETAQLATAVCVHRLPSAVETAVVDGYILHTTPAWRNVAVSGRGRRRSMLRCNVFTLDSRHALHESDVNAP